MNNSNWTFTTFQESFELCSKTKRKAGEGLEFGSYKFFTSSPRQSKFLDSYEFEGDHLIFGTGGMPSVHYCSEKFSTSTDCFVVRTSDKEIFLKFVYYFFKGNMHVLAKGFRGAGLKHLSRAYLNSVKIPKPPLETQKKIVEVLEKVEKLIDFRGNSYKLTDEFLKSVFYDIVYSNKSKDWGIKTINDLVDPDNGGIRTGPFGSDLLHSEFVDEGVAVIGIDNAVDNKFSWKERRFITLEKYQKLKKYTLYPRDVIITIMGTLGRTAVIPDNIPSAINTKHLAAITLNKSMANPFFISFSFRTDPYILAQLKGKNRGAIMDGLNLTIIKEIKVKLPPIELQNKFASLYERVEKLKAIQTHSKIYTQNLFNSLMQSAFKGELLC